MKLFLILNEKNIENYLYKIYKYSLKEERVDDVVGGQGFKEYYKPNWDWPDVELNTLPGLNYYIFSVMCEKLVDGFCELLETYNGLLVSDLWFKNGLKNLFSGENKELFVKIWLVLLKEYYMRNTAYWGSLRYAQYGRSYEFEELINKELLKFIFKIDLFTREEFVTLHYMQNKMYLWSVYRSEFIQNGYNFDTWHKSGTKDMRMNISKNLSILPLEYCFPEIDIYEVYQRILKNREWLVHPEMLLDLSVEKLYEDNNYNYCFNYSEIKKIEKLNDFYWEEFSLKSLPIGEEEKRKEKYWYMYPCELSRFNCYIDEFFSSFNENQKTKIKNYYLIKGDYILGEEWKDQIKNWGNNSDYFVEDQLKVLNFFGWDWYQSKSPFFEDFTFEEFQEYCREYWGVEIEWKEE